VAVVVTAGRLASATGRIAMGKFQDLMDRELRIRGLAENTRSAAANVKNVAMVG